MAPNDDSDPPDVAIRDAVCRVFTEFGLERELVDLLNGTSELATIKEESGSLEVTIRFPIPSGRMRERIERNLRTVAPHLDGVTEIACRFAPRVADPGERVAFLPDVKHVLAVASGKGGVGKSTVATNLAVSLASSGVSVGLLDADMYGPNIPRMCGLEGLRPRTTHEDMMIPPERYGVKVMSMGFLAGEDDPIIWRGPVVDDVVKQLLDDVTWGPLDYLIVDLPPGTGDTHLTLVQQLPLSGVVLVTTPQTVATDDATRCLRGFERYDVEILGICENMAEYTCPDCDSVHDIFGTGGASALGESFGVPVLGNIPIDPCVNVYETDDVPTAPGISIPKIGRLQLPRTSEERAERSQRPPIAIRTGGGAPRQAFEQVSIRLAARLDVRSAARDHNRDGGSAGASPG